MSVRKTQGLKTFFPFQNIPSLDHRREISWEMLRAAGQQCSGAELASFCLQALFRTRHWAAASAPTPIVCLFISLLLMVLPGGCCRESCRVWSLLKSFSECWHMPFKHGLKWILITPLIEQAGKHLSANISQGHFF